MKRPVAAKAAKPRGKPPRGRPFQPGQSGNPRGLRKGTRHHHTVMAEMLKEGDIEAVVAKVVSKAKRGDMAAARLLVDRVLPARKGQPVPLALPPIQTAADIVVAEAAIWAAMTSGKLTSEEADGYYSALENHRKAIETAALETLASRVTAIEQKVGS